MASDPGIEFGATVRGFSAGLVVLGRFELIRMLGRGGMGVVWLARDTKLRIEIALKFLPEAVGGDEAAVADLARETLRARDLAHHHIVRVYDFHQDDGLAAISMEHVDGPTMTGRRLEQPDEIFQPGQLLPWVEQLSEALDYAHRKARVVHRDLKPTNLMLTSRGDLKVADFGISASVSESVTRVSRVASSSGSPPYMSPQQMFGDRPAATDDIYAVGATLYELLTGRPPFYTGNIVLQVQEKVPPRVADRREELELPVGEIPESWERTIAACLSKKPEERPGSAGELFERLTAVDKPAPAPPPVPIEPAVEGGPPAPPPIPSEPAASTPPPPAAKDEKPVEARGGSEPPPVAAIPPKAPRSAPAPGDEKPKAAAPPPPLKKGEPPSAKQPKASRQPPPEKPIEEKPAAVAATSGVGKPEPEKPKAKKAESQKEPPPAKPAKSGVGRKLAWTFGVVAAAVGVAFGIAYVVDKNERERRWQRTQEIMNQMAQEQQTAAAATGSVSISTTPPGASVTVDSASAQSSPAYFTNLTAGRHTVVAKMDGFEDWSGGFDAEAGQTATLNLALQRSTGGLEIDSNPSKLNFVLSGQGRTERGTTPTTLNDLPTGEYTLAVSHPGVPDQNTSVTVLRQQTVSVKPDFLRSVSFSSDPPGALVRVTGGDYDGATFSNPEGKQLVTPFNGRIRPGTYDFTFELDGYETAVRNALIADQEPAEFYVALEEARKGPKEGAAWTAPRLDLTMIWLNPGTFDMGSPSHETNRSSDEGPVTTVRLTRGFWLGKYEVTQRQWEEIMGQNPSQFANAGPDAPVENVSWLDAMDFCHIYTESERLAGRLPDDLAYTLPTEAQWEYACRAGTNSPVYTGELTYRGENDSPELDRIGWYTGNSGVNYAGGSDSTKWEEKQYDHSVAGTHPVGLKQPNAWGFYDMIGNVWEWTDGWYGSYPGGMETDYVGSFSGEDRVLRGGGWFVGPRHCRSAHRHHAEGSGHGNGVGFRLALCAADASESSSSGKDEDPWGKGKGGFSGGK